MAKGSDAGLSLSTSFRCSSCLLTVEADGAEITDEAREAFYRAEGRWSVRLRALGPRSVEVLRVLRGELGQSPQAILRMARDAQPITTGTRVEVDRMAGLLMRAGADVDVTRLD